MKLRLLIVVFLIAATKLSLHAQNYLPTGAVSSGLVSPYIYGYYFQATTDFTICGLKVKYDNNVSPTNQRLFVVKFTSAPVAFTSPPFTTSTQITSFTVTGANVAQTCNITVNNGEYIGVYGYRESPCRNYFASFAGSLTVNAVSMPLTRSGAAFTGGCGGTPTLTGFFSETSAAGPLGAIELSTNCCFIPTTSLTQPSCTSTTGSVTLTGLPPGNWTVNSYLNGSVTPTNSYSGSGSSYTFSGLTGGSYTFNVVNSNGCPSSNTNAVVINASPTLPVASIANNTGVSVLTCSQASISLTGTGNGTNSYWYNGAVLIGSNPTISATSPGTYNFTTTIGTCSNTASIVITQNIATPTATITGTNNQLNCTLTSFLLSANTGAGLTYQWRQNNNPIPGATSATYTVTAPGNYTVVVTSTSNGCSTTSANYPVTQFTGTTVAVNNPTICSGQTTTLTAVPVLTGGTFSWVSNGAITNSISVNPNSNTTYTVNYTINGCTSAATSTVTVNPTPSVSVNNASICPGINTTLTAVGSPSGGTYTWSPNSQAGASIVVNPTTTTNFVVTYNLNGCTPGTATSAVTVLNSIDFANILYPGLVAICQGQTLTIFGQVYEAGITPPVGQGAGITVEYAYNSNNTDPSTWPSNSWSLAAYNSLATTNPNNDEYIGVIPSLPVGTYYYSFRYAINGCYSYGAYSSAGGGFWNGTNNVNGMLIVNPNITPTFNPISAVCSGSTISALPIISLNQIQGSWSPALNNQQTTIYTFTPLPNVCATTATTSITINPLPIASISTSGTTVLNCTTTSISLIATGGVSYSWSNGTTVVGTDATLVVTAPGTYTVTATAANGCTDTEVQTITQNIVAPTAVINPPSTSVLTCATTSISLTTSGGTSYSWSNGTAEVGTDAILPVTTPGTYTVTATNSANGCTDTEVQIITQNIVAPTAVINPPSTSVLTCTTTSISLTASGGTSYSWSNGTTVVGTAATLAVTAPGTYTVTATNSVNGCTDTEVQTITQNIAAPTAVINPPSTSVLTCANSSISLSAQGGTSYSWSNGTTVVGTAATLPVTSPGTYTVTVTAANGCTDTEVQIITQDIVVPTAVISPPSTSVLTCVTTSISLSAQGGTSYSWSNGTTVVGTAATLAVTAPGTYTVTATAANGCVDTEVQIITQNIVVPTAVINPPSTSVLTCTTTSISLTASGGTSYSWSNGTAVVGTAATLAVTAPGTYTVTVTAANGCTDTEFRIITQNIAPPTAGINPPNSTILNCTTTSISLTATGGTSYSWSNGTAVVGTTATLPVTAPGTYTVTATNSVNGCTDTEVQIITQTIVPPLAGINPPSTSVLTCSTASISLTATGGTSYSWSNGTSVVGTAATLAVTTPGTYTVTATNSANGCTDTEVQIITQNIVVPNAVINPPSTSVLTCTTTSISLTASGGTSYSWSNGTAVVGTAATLAVTAPGTYTVTVTAANGCTDMEVQTITQVISAPTAGINPPNATEINCTSTSIPLTATGGVSYSWSNGTAVVGTAATLAVTAPGTYTVTATAANGCTDTEVQIITQNIVVPTAVISPPSTSVLTCATTSISLTASGGTSYSWSNGTTVVGTAATLPITTPGTYTVTATAANGCIDTEVQTITQNIVVPTAVINPPSTSVLTCTTTSISLTASGGTSYSWSNGTAVVGTAATLPLTVPGTYTVTATNGVNGCTDTEVQIITQNIVVPTAVISPPSTSVLTCATTSISLTASGGTSYAWSNGNAVVGTAATLPVTSPGTYTVTVTAANGCTDTEVQIITQDIVVPTAVINPPSTSVLTCATTSISLSAQGGTSYSWSNGTTVVGTAATLPVTSPGTYTVTVTAANGCTDTEAQIITQDIVVPTAVINPPSTSVLTCTTTSISLTASGGTSYSWSNGTAVVGTAATLAVTAPGTYTVTATAANGCADTEMETITQNIVSPIVSISNGSNTTVLDCNTSQISLTGNGGLSVTWSNASGTLSNNASLLVTNAGSYTYTGTDANGCFSTETVIITFSPNTDPLFTQIPDICVNGNFSLPSISNNGVQGTWTPSPNFTTTTTYTFQPNAGLCANTTDMTVVVHEYPVISTLNDTICFGQNTSIIPTVDLAGGTYTWSPFTSAAPNITVSPTSTTTYQVVYSLFGCNDTSITEIYVKPVSIPQVANQTICTGENATLTASAGIAGGDFIWSNGQTTSSINVNPSTTTNYSVQYDLDGCLSSSVNSTVTVNPVPTLGVNNVTICAGDIATLTAIVNLPGGTFTWGNPPVAGGSSLSITPLSNTSITVNYSLNGCNSLPATSTITVKPLPIATFTSNVTEGCVPLSVTFTADDPANTDYTWTTSNLLNGNGASSTINFQSSGDFNVSLTTNLNGCIVTETANSYIQVDDYPIASFSSSVLVFSEQNQFVQFENNSIGAASYSWSFGDGQISTLENPDHIFLSTDKGTTILLTAISLHGCTDTVSFEIPFDPGLIYYIPNSFTPDGDMFNQTFQPVFSSGIDPYNYKLRIYNRWGEIIFESNDLSIGWDGSYGLEGTKCQTGTYTYEIIMKMPNFDERTKITGTVNLIR